MATNAQPVNGADRAMAYMVYLFGKPPRGKDEDGNETADWWMARLGLLVGFVNWDKKQTAETLAAAVDLVRAAGCVCESLWSGCGEREFNGEALIQEDDVAILRHDTSCPQALADAIERRG
jgi:hypothetical protein